MVTRYAWLRLSLSPLTLVELHTYLPLTFQTESVLVFRRVITTDCSGAGATAATVTAAINTRGHNLRRDVRANGREGSNLK